MACNTNPKIKLLARLHSHYQLQREVFSCLMWAEQSLQWTIKAKIMCGRYLSTRTGGLARRERRKEIGGKVKGEGRGNGRRESGEERGGYSALEESLQAQEECVKRVLGKKIALCQQEQNPHMTLAVLVR